MADPNIGQVVASAWEAKVGTKPTDNIHNSYWLLHQFDNGDGYLGLNGGRKIEISLEYAINTTFKSYDDLEGLDTTRIDVFDAAQYDWKQVAGTVVISEKEKSFTQGSGGKFDLLASKLDNAKNSHDYEINRQMYTDGTGNAGKDIGGLDLIVPTSPLTGIVGGINRATFSWWRSQTVEDAGTAYNALRANMTTVYNLCARGVGGEYPNVIISDATVFAAYEGLLVAVEQIVDKRQADIAFKGENIKFKGAQYGFDTACAAAVVFELNTKFLKLAYQRGYWKKMFPPVQPANQTADVYKILTIANLVTSSSRRLGKVWGIA